MKKRLNEQFRFQLTASIPLILNSTDNQIDFLYQSGYTSAKKFLEKWDFEEYKVKRMRKQKGE